MSASNQQLSPDCLQYAVDILQDVVVPEADNPVAESFDGPSPLGVDFFPMLPAIQFDDDVPFAACEVGDVPADWELAGELRAFQLARAEMPPEQLFGVGAAGSELTHYGRQALFSQG